MFRISTGEKAIDINEQIEDAANEWVAENSFINGSTNRFETYDVSKVSHAIADAMLDVLSQPDAYDLFFSDRSPFASAISKALKKVDSFETGEVIEADFSIHELVAA
jgi:hypothetical protein